jgi:hypothetical protein
MSAEDVKIIFGNITELAIFADAFSEAIEAALGALIEGHTGEDRVGKLFLETVRVHLSSPCVFSVPLTLKKKNCLFSRVCMVLY